ncbi:membrane lipoprotein lipid attachment site-containing protein [Lacticaseibacillus baoqingensis]|uniref:Membrane lipoprotein lipid attachment site-containing protein n=1 Tax=Lacticaseibacillus baoqingensis TaxID=2486013 RepID=A0ABW4E5E3_9LACO|nr:membrane lipoprotein lipid attachment site-containing protein [Lacticaseibacillus baoqingensis]
MKKIALLAVTILALTGCSTHNTKSSQSSQASKTATVSQPAVKTVDYQQLAKADQDKVSFTFLAKATDDTAATYNVKMQVTNQSKKAVKLDAAKIVWTKGDQADVIKADQQKAVTVKPHQTQSVTKLFTNFKRDHLTAAGAFCYLNADDKLAYSYQAFKDGGVTSKNLTDKHLITLNTPADQTSQVAQASSSAASQSATASTSQSSSSAKAPATAAPKYTGQQLALLAQIYGQQDPASVNVADALNNMQQLAVLSYAADSNTSGHSSEGTGVSYEQFSVSGSNLVITHPATQGSSAWSGTVDLNTALAQVFGQNAAAAQAVLAKMTQE